MQNSKLTMGGALVGVGLGIAGLITAINYPIKPISAQESGVKEDSFDPQHYWYGPKEYNLMDPSQFKEVLTTQFRESRSVGLRLLVEENEKKYIVPVDNQLRKLIEDCNSGYTSLRKKVEQAKANPKDPKLESYKDIIVRPDMQIVKGNISVGDLREVIDQELTTFNFDPNDNQGLIRARRKWHDTLVEKQREALPKGLVSAIDNYVDTSRELSLTPSEDFFRKLRFSLTACYIVPPENDEYWQENPDEKLPLHKDLVSAVQSSFDISQDEIIKMRSSALTMAGIEPSGIEGLIRSSPTNTGSKEVTVFDNHGNLKGVIYLDGRVVKIN